METFSWNASIERMAGPLLGVQTSTGRKKRLIDLNNTRKRTLIMCFWEENVGKVGNLCPARRPHRGDEKAI